VFYIGYYTDGILGKKLKKRLEDLEKRANSNSASPEQRPVGLAKPKSQRKKDSGHLKGASSSAKLSQSHSQPIRGSEPTQIGFLPLQGDPLFSEQYSRALSQSPPLPVAYPVASVDMFAYPAFSSQGPYPTISSSCHDPSIYAYQTPFPSPYSSSLNAVDFPVKQDLFTEVDSLQLSVGFPPLSSVDLPQTISFADSTPHVNLPFPHAS
jgi:hypothetical protein